MLQMVTLQEATNRRYLATIRVILDQSEDTVNRGLHLGKARCKPRMVYRYKDLTEVPP